MGLRCFACRSKDPGERWWGKTSAPWYWFCTSCSFDELQRPKVDLALENYIGMARWARGAPPRTIRLWCGHGVSIDATGGCTDCARVFAEVAVYDVVTGLPFMPRTLPVCRHCTTTENLETVCPTCSSTLCRYCIAYDSACPKCTELVPRQICRKCRAFLPIASTNMRTHDGRLIRRGQVFFQEPPKVVCDRCGDERHWISTRDDRGLLAIKILEDGAEC